MNPFIQTITSSEPEQKNRSLSSLCCAVSPKDLFAYCEELEDFRKQTDNLYHRVRATLFLYAVYRFFLMESKFFPSEGEIPIQGHEDLLFRRFDQAISCFRRVMKEKGPNAALISALAESYHHLSFQILLNQVRRSVRASSGNQWMFRVG
ncbi:UTP--glucose-1-phosphate uridylyltransferase, partial [Candidatus Sumerlaeota bacterium]|nr:UTP--glucose-1-phosphate uridylyltransferase [Candidatus Sumerlaeota bacterium]